MIANQLEGAESYVWHSETDGNEASDLPSLDGGDSGTDGEGDGEWGHKW